MPDFSIEEEFNAPVIGLDEVGRGPLAGPVISCGCHFKNYTILNEFKDFIGDSKKAYMTYKKFASDVKIGETILLDDGKLIFEVVKSDKKENVTAKVIQGGSFNSNKGVNLPNTKISLPALTKKDIEDAIFAIKQEVD